MLNLVYKKRRIILKNLLIIDANSTLITILPKITYFIIQIKNIKIILTTFYCILNFKNPIYGGLEIDTILQLGEFWIEELLLSKNLSLITLFHFHILSNSSRNGF